MKVLKGKEQLTLNYGRQNLNGNVYNHKGIDIVKYKNELDYIIAIEDGEVISTRTGIRGFAYGSYGNYVYLKHKNGYKSFYAHLSRVDVQKGDRVKKGQVIGYMGDSGMAYGAHLHVEIEKDNKLINPYPYVFENLTFDKENKKSINAIAKEVIDGKWGNGEDRKNRLTKSGYNYTEIQNEVNRILLGNNKKSINEIAREVINGKWGNGEDRKNRLKKAGYNYNLVQQKVNEILL